MLQNRDPIRRADASVSALVGSRVNYWSTFGIDILAGSWFLWRGIALGGLTAAGPFGALLAVLGGWWVWTLFEYGVHRHVFHGVGSQASRAHLAHHRAPRELVGLPFFVPVSIALLWWIAVSAVLPQAQACLVVAGSYVGYIGYGAVHHATHARALHLWPFERRQRMHRVHHARVGTNFGVTTSLWDRAFRTHADVRPGDVSP